MITKRLLAGKLGPKEAFVMSEQPAKEQKKKETQPDKQQPYLEHGVPSLVAMDNPDDFQLRDEKAPKRGSRR